MKRKELIEKFVTKVPPKLVRKSNNYKAYKVSTLPAPKKVSKVTSLFDITEKTKATREEI